MENYNTFEEFLASTTTQIPIFNFIFGFILTFILSFILSKLYVRYANTLSNRVLFSKNFILISMTTMLIITIVKSSLALSLGLVGALSIIRFRAAIKEPEELAYLFLNIAIGLGFGANQLVITTISFLIISIIIALKGNYVVDNDQYLTINISGKIKKNLAIDDFLNIIKKYCTTINLKRFSELKDRQEYTFIIEIGNYSDLSKINNAIKKIDNSIEISFFDNKGPIA